MAVIARFPGGESRVIWIDDLTQLQQTVNQYRSGLKRYVVRTYDPAPAQQLYAQLIQPFEAELTASGTNTLVFVHDGFLRNIPMAALYDGQQYLIQRFAVATTPSLSLTAPAAEGRDLRVLALGLSQPAVMDTGRQFPGLKSVPAELAFIAEELPGSTTLLNQEFTIDRLEQTLGTNTYPILHLATHGQFSTIPEDTFVITGPEADGTSRELTFGQLEVLLRQTSPNADPIDLITLTACETATGDDRATLGLAGVAIRAGARTAIASLWKVDDAAAAQLIRDFYANLQNSSFSKAQALQMAQIAAIERAGTQTNPGTWAPLILVGNWQ